MIKGNLGRKKIIPLLVGTAMLGLAACDSPEEKAQAYYQNAVQLFEEENYEKAGLEFRNALQLNETIADAWYHLALLEEKAGKVREYAGDLFKTVELDPNHVPAQVRIGKLMLFSGRLSEAEEKSNMAMRLDPQNPDVWSLRSALLLRQDKHEEATEAALKALELEAGHVEGSLILAAQALTKKDPDTAIKYVEDSLKTHPDNVSLHLTKMRSLESKGDLDGIESVFRTLIEQNPENREFRNNLVRFYLTRDEKGKAEAEVRAIVTDNPDDEDAKIDLIRFLQVVNGTDKAVEELDKIIGANPEGYVYQLAKAELVLSTRNVEGAKEILQQVIQKAGTEEDGLSARVNLAEMLLREQDRAGAEKLIEETIAADPFHTNALLIRAGLKLDDGKIEDGITDLRSALRDEPDSVQATLLLARAHEMNGAIELAEDRFDAAYKISNAGALASMQYAQFLGRRAEYERAEDIIKRALRTSPRDAGLLTALAQAKLIQKDWQGAAEVAEQLRKLDKDNVVSDQILARSYAGQEDFDKSIESFRQAYENVPNGANTIVSLVRLYMSQGKPEEAEKFLRDIAAQDQGNVPARILLAQLLLVLDREDEAVQEYDKLVAEAPKEQNVYYTYVTYKIRKKDYDGAKEVLDKGRAALPESFTLLLTEAGIYELQKDYVKAISIYEDALKVRPNSDVVANNLASLISQVYDDEENLRKAYTYAKRFRSSQVPHFQDTLGWIHYRLGEYQLAVTLLEEAVEKAPEFGLLRYHLGMSYKAQNDKKQAMEHLSKAIEISKTRPFAEAEDAKKALEALQAS